MENRRSEIALRIGDVRPEFAVGNFVRINNGMTMTGILIKRTAEVGQGAVFLAEAVESAVALIDIQRDLFALRFKCCTGLVDILIEQGETVVNRCHQVVQLMLGR